ncbi:MULTISPECIES: Crp/Fnr family transcriptional regulator [Persicobacter]|uniref:Crp/Fnr family transcriptional regulator n=1 Tax=Persicobacter diffluens TaxID=981 RepID=A0AAN5AIJ9_9BACT|nr:Crp/Fnr family transcriptional regulator [Persicobacter sp. CCB-QB2]GJM60520.1 Crp/Fnr family transcriptional regulator [Persicobacter diffluens]
MADRQLWYFEEVDLFNILCPRKSAMMGEKHSLNEYGKDEFIYLEDDPSDQIFLIASGRVKIGGYTDDGKEIVRAILGPGELFGEMGLAGELVREDFAQAMDNKTQLCKMSLDDLREMMKDNQPLNLQMIKLIGLRLRKLERRIDALVFKDARTRIVEFLLDLAEERGQKVGFETMIKNHFTHKDIAKLTGTSRQTVTTILNELKEKNLINFDRRRILIRDVEQLKQSESI